MSMLDSFFSKSAFKSSKCKTLLKLTIPRIKLLRNRREIQIKQMRRDIAKLLEIGQEATTRIRVEHIIREEKMMAAQEIIELYCELVAVRLPIIEAQRECPLDLKEAISSLCFAAPRCADLTELMQVQMCFAAKYSKEFVAAATELRPECGVNRQLIELLSVHAPAPDVKLKLLKEIAEEHELDWDPTASETESLKPHEDLLDGPTQLVRGSKSPLPQDESVHIASVQTHEEHSGSDSDFELIDFPEVPDSSVLPTSSLGGVSRPEMLPFPASALSDLNHNSETSSVTTKSEDLSMSTSQEKQFLPFIAPPSTTYPSPAATRPAPSAVPRPEGCMIVELQDVFDAAHAAAESAEQSAAAARSAASLAQFRISELIKKQNKDNTSNGNNENPFYEPEKPNLDHQESSQGHDSVTVHHEPQRSAASLGQVRISELIKKQNENEASNGNNENPFFGLEKPNLDHQESSQGHDNVTVDHKPQRLPSLDDGSFMSFPNLFTSRTPGDLSRA